VNFAAGSSELDAAATQRLDLLAEALNKRPGLTLVARGSTHPQHDREQLQKTALDQQLLSAGLSAGDISEHTPAWEEAVRKRYQAQGEAEADLPIALQYQHLWQNLAVADEALSALAQERATSAKRYLVNTAGLGSDRAVIEWDKPGDDAAAGFSGVEMALD
jgi:predicted transcriptional regulator